MAQNRTVFPGSVTNAGLTTTRTLNSVYLPERSKIATVIIRLTGIVGANNVTLSLWDDAAASLLIFGEGSTGATQAITPGTVATTGGVSFAFNQLLPRMSTSTVGSTGLHLAYYGLKLGAGTATLVSASFDCVWGGEQGITV